MRILFALLLLFCSFGLLADETLAAPKAKSATVVFPGIGTVEFEDPPSGTLIRYTLDGREPAKSSYAYCVPLKVASSLKVKAACFRPDGTCGPVSIVECTKTGPDDGNVAINVDFSETPDLKDFALNIVKASEEYYKTICEMLPSDGYTPPRQVMYFIKKEGKGVAATGGTKVTFSHDYYVGHPNDIGSAIHELVHVVQNYGSAKGSKHCPGWMTEGIADWVRWCNWEKPDNRRKVNPARSDYKRGYSDAAAFLDWIGKTYDKDVVKKLNAASRKGEYDEVMFKEITKKDFATLWTEYSHPQ